LGRQVAKRYNGLVLQVSVFFFCMDVFNLRVDFNNFSLKIYIW